MVANNIIDLDCKKQMMAILDTDLSEVENQMTKVRTMQSKIKALLKDGLDYGVIEGCSDKPTLFKAGAEKVLMAFGLQSEYELIKSTEIFEGKGFFSYTVKSQIHANGVKITEGFGHANSKETKWAYKWVTKDNIPKEVNIELLPSKEKDGKYGKYRVYRIEEDMNSKANTILKMAKKRAQVDAVLTVASLSEIFTQDFDDLSDEPQKTPQDKVEEIKEQIKQKNRPDKSPDYICSCCGKSIKEAAFAYSQKKFNKPLCYNCQQKERKKIDNLPPKSVKGKGA